MISHENKLFALEHLTPMITSHSVVENQISKSALPRATLFALCAFGHWHLVIGHPRNGTLPAMPVPPVVTAVERSKVEWSLSNAHYSPFAILYMPTTSGDIQQKNRQPIFGGVETSMKMTFHSPGESQRRTRRRCGSTFHKPPFIFPLGKCV